MPAARLLVDSSYLYALLDTASSGHAQALALADLYHATFVIPDVVLTEAAFLFNRQGGVPAVLAFLDRLALMHPQLEAVSPADLIRVRAIMADYRDARLDFVDCCIMALSERLNISQICTFDRRDFAIFRPLHTAHLELLP